MDNDSRSIVHAISTGTILRIAFVILILVALFYLRDVILILLTAVVIASAIEPATQWLTRKSIPRVLAVVFIYIAIIILLIGLFYLILPSFLDDMVRFMDILPNHITALNVKTDGIGSDFFGWQSAVEGLSSSKSLEQAAQNGIAALSSASGSVFASLTTIFGGLSSFLIIIVLSFYLAVQEKGIEDFLKIVTPLRKETYVIDLWQRTQRKIGRWMQGQVLLALIVGILVYIGLSLLGVENAFLLAIMATVLEVIPVFGPFIAAVPAVLIASLQGGITFGIIVALLYIVIQQVESNVVYPLVVKKVVDVHPLVVIIALIVGAKLGGFLGILLSVPLATALTEFLGDVSKSRVAERERMSHNGV